MTPFVTFAQRRDHLFRRWQELRSITLVAAEAGIDRSTVSKLLAKVPAYREETASREASNSEWPASRIARLRELWGSPDFTRRMIAESLGVTLNSVIGKAHRLGLPDRPKSITSGMRPVGSGGTRAAVRKTLPPLPSTTKEPPPMVIADARQIVLAAPVVAPEPPPPVILTFPTLALPPPVYSRCQWPTNDGDGMRWTFCGSGDVEAGRPYCLSHCLIAYNGYRRRECVTA